MERCTRRGLRRDPSPADAKALSQKRRNSAGKTTRRRLAVIVPCKRPKAVTNLRKQVSAKTAWARLSASNRRLREALEQIARTHDPRSPAEAAHLLRTLRELAQAALADDSRQDRAA